MLSFIRLAALQLSWKSLAGAVCSEEMLSMYSNMADVSSIAV